MPDLPDSLVIEAEPSLPRKSMEAEIELSKVIRWRYRIATVFLWLAAWVLQCDLEVKHLA